MSVRSKILIAIFLDHWFIKLENNDIDKTGMSYVCSEMKMVDLTTTYLVILIQGCGYLLENEFTE